MSERPKKFEDLTTEQQIAFKKAGRTFATKMLFNGVNTGALLFVSIFILAFANVAFIQSMPLFLIAAGAVGIYLGRLMNARSKELADTFKAQVDKILEPK